MQKNFRPVPAANSINVQAKNKKLLDNFVTRVKKVYKQGFALKVTEKTIQSWKTQLSLRH